MSNEMNSYYAIEAMGCKFNVSFSETIQRTKGKKDQFISPKTATLCIISGFDPLAFYAGVSIKQRSDENDPDHAKMIAFKRASSVLYHSMKCGSKLFSNFMDMTTDYDDDEKTFVGFMRRALFEARDDEHAASIKERILAIKKEREELDSRFSDDIVKSVEKAFFAFGNLISAFGMVNSNAQDTKTKEEAPPAQPSQ